MEKSDGMQHWEAVYKTKGPHEVSWTQEIPKTSLEFIKSFGVSKDVNIIDVGGGDSNLVDFLLDAGYENITVLDISKEAIDRAKKRLGDRAKKVNWIVSDITEFKPPISYGIWHDRATFHFLIHSEQIAKYMERVMEAVTGFMVVGTFSKNGPTKCSGLEIKQYSEATLAREFNNKFSKIRCITEDHTTPFNTKQNFVFCSFRRN